jgi:hypothetical protein
LPIGPTKAAQYPPPAAVAQQVHVTAADPVTAVEPVLDTLKHATIIEHLFDGRFRVKERSWRPDQRWQYA